MSSLLSTVLVVLACFAVAYGVCEWIVRRLEGGGPDDTAAG